MAETTATIRIVIARTIRRRLTAQWQQGGELLTPIQFPGVTGLMNDLSGGMISNPPSRLPWLKLDLRWAGSDEFTISQPALNRNIGVIQLAVFVISGKGTTELDELVGRARTVFDRFYGEGGLICRASSPGPDLKDGAWIGSTIQTDFYCHEQTS